MVAEDGLAKARSLALIVPVEVLELPYMLQDTIQVLLMKIKRQN